MDVDCEDFGSKIELNVTNQNEEGVVVINDLRLLELLHMYPYLFSKQVCPQQDPDYDEWGWEQITNDFNSSYEDLNLGSPFSVEELQWRWDILRPLMGTLSKSVNTLPSELSSIIQKVNHMLNAEKPHNVKTATTIENFLLEQLPYVEALSELQRRRLEVEIIDTILLTEMKLKVPDASGSNQNEVVQSEYDSFLKDIRVKELPSESLDRFSGPGGAIFVAVKPSSAASSTVTTNIANKSRFNIVTKQHGSLVISSVYTAKQFPFVAGEPEDPATVPTSSPEACRIKIEPPDIMDNVHASSPVTKICIQPDLPQFIPIKSAKYYVKKVRVRVKRLNLNDYMPLAKIKKKTY